MSTKVDLKVVVLGKEYVGKTALVERFLNNSFAVKNGYQPTIGAAYGARKLKNFENIPIIMGIWDTAGSERFQSMTRMYYRSAKAAILCYDMCDTVSFRHLDFWVKELKNAEPDCKIFLCGCKSDLVGPLKSDRPISEHVVSEYAKSLKVKSFETSSKTGSGIIELFQTICDDVSQSSDFMSDTMKKNIILSESQTPQKSGPCAQC